jgi:hypothetical protein
MTFKDYTVFFFEIFVFMNFGEVQISEYRIRSKQTNDSILTLSKRTMADQTVFFYM